MPTSISRRDFLVRTTAAGGGVAMTRSLAKPTVIAARGNATFKISLAQWSLHGALQGGQLDHLDFAKVARTEFDLDAIEYVNRFFMDKARNAVYLKEMNRRARDHGVFQHLIMCDDEGHLGDPDPARRTRAIENHYKWVDAAAALGCITIRVNAESEGGFEEQQKLAADGLHRLTEYGAAHDINVIVENHEGLSSHGDWLVGVMKLVDHPRCGTLPDFGNFENYDRYKGVAELMPYAKAVSAKSYDFDDRGEETTLDYRRLMKTVVGARFHSWIGIEFEGNRLSERVGIAKTKTLLERVRAEFAAGGHPHRPGSDL
jgi:sugar phosphate isomerase/epimerase